MSSNNVIFHPAAVFPVALFLSGCGISSLAAWPLQSIFEVDSPQRTFEAATATAAQPWAQVVLPKPTYTPWPTPTNLPTEAGPIETSPALESFYAEIVPDTPAPALPSNQENTNPVWDSSSMGSGSVKYILVDISQQHLYAYEGESLVYSFVASTGLNNATAVGNFSVLSKIPNAYGATWNIWMPNWLGIYWAGGLQNGIHALPILPNGAQLWSGYLGSPISYGCVVLGANESKLLYDWVEIGTPVDIQW